MSDKADYTTALLGMAMRMYGCPVPFGRSSDDAVKEGVIRLDGIEISSTVPLLV